MTNIIIDCDPGHDDAVAILLALRHLPVIALTTVSGNAPLDAVTNNALALLELARVNIPVHAGASRPTTGDPIYATHVHGATGFGGTVMPASTSKLASNDAVAALVQAALEVDDLWIVAIGPLTNIAHAIARDPEFAKRIAGISIMGGSTTVGNATPSAEFNILADPEAAHCVFSSGANLKMCGLNLTRQLMTDDLFIQHLRGQGNVADFIADLYEHMHARMLKLTGVRRSALHDPCAVLAISHPELIRFEPRHGAVELEGALTRGMTVIDERPRPSEGPPRAPANVEVAYGIDAEQARALILHALLSYS